MNTHTNSSTQMTINDLQFPIFSGAIKAVWVNTAKEKGFNFVARIVDRMHFALECQLCGHINKVRLFTLTSAQPLCEGCIALSWRADASAAGLTFLHRCPEDRHYGHFLRKACGHTIRRQFTKVNKVATGITGLRCETCHAKRERAEAVEQGWELIGPDDEGDLNFRKYRHGCGHEQRIARQNMQSGRLSCHGCGVDWPSAPSSLYALSFTLQNGREVVKLGYSNNPKGRLHFQLAMSPAMPRAILRLVAVPSGHQALVIEKRLHRDIRKTHPDLIIDPAVYRGQIRVASEIYDVALTRTILDHLDRVDAEINRSAA